MISQQVTNKVDQMKMENVVIHTLIVTFISLQTAWRQTLRACCIFQGPFSSYKEMIKKKKKKKLLLPDDGNQWLWRWFDTWKAESSRSKMIPVLTTVWGKRFKTGDLHISPSTVRDPFKEIWRNFRRTRAHSWALRVILHPEQMI